jgi:hypothetical protein
MRGHQPYGLRADLPPGEGVGGDVLRFELLDEVERATAAGAFLRARRRLEERADGVEITVGVAAGRAAAERRTLQTLRPRSAVPQQPQGLFCGASTLQEFARLAQEGAQPLGAAGVRRIVRDKALGLGERRRPAPRRAAPGRDGADRRCPCLRAGRSGG